VVVIEKVKCYLYLITKKWTKKEISSLAKFMPKHNRGPTPNVTKDNAFIGSCKIITRTKKIEIVKLRNVAT
jgi:serine/threonine-protein kinase RIO1